MAYKMKGSPMQRNFGIKPSPAKAIFTGLALLGGKIATLIAGKAGAVAAAGATGANVFSGAAATKVAVGQAVKQAALGVVKKGVVKAAAPALLGTGVSKLLSGGSKKQHVQAPNKTAGMKPIMEEKER
jgi:hypothetical protein